MRNLSELHVPIDAGSWEKMTADVRGEWIDLMEEAEAFELLNNIKAFCKARNLEISHKKEKTK